MNKRVGNRSREREFKFKSVRGVVKGVGIRGI